MQGKESFPEVIPEGEAILPGRNKAEVLAERLGRLSADDYNIATRARLSEEDMARLKQSEQLQITRDLYLELKSFELFWQLA